MLQEEALIISERLGGIQWALLLPTAGFASGKKVQHQ